MILVDILITSFTGIVDSSSSHHLCFKVSVNTSRFRDSVQGVASLLILSQAVNNYLISQSGQVAAKSLFLKHVQRSD